MIMYYAQKQSLVNIYAENVHSYTYMYRYTHTQIQQMHAHTHIHTQGRKGGKKREIQKDI